jgi:hypothetical protein
MVFKKTLAGLVTAAFLTLGSSWAGNDRLSEVQPVPAGERAANYLQVLLTSASQIIATQNAGGLFSDHEPYRVAVTYDPDNKVIEASVVGTKDKLEDAKAVLDIVEKLILSFNKRLQKNFGVTLSETDIYMDYLNARTSQSVVKYKNGQYVTTGSSTSAAQEIPSK